MRLPRYVASLSATVSFALFCGAAEPGGGEAPWPTLHRDYQRSGYTSEFVRGPYERKWYRDFHEEMIATRLEAIVAEGKCFVGTFAGKLCALNVADGSTAWEFRAGGPIGHSACYHSGKLYFGCDEGFGRGRLYCLAASDGRKLWEYEAGAGIWVAPATDGEKVYFGDRAGVFHAVSGATRREPQGRSTRRTTGRKAWTFETGCMILTPASFSPDMKRIVFASEDMHVYCLSPSGRLLWKSSKLAGLSVRDHAPTIWRGLAIVRTNPADGFHETLDRNRDVLQRIQKAIPLGQGGEGDRVIGEHGRKQVWFPTAKRLEAEAEGVVRYLEENPHDRTFYAFRLEDGEEPWIAPVFFTCGLHNPPTAPTFNPKTGELYTYYRSALSNYSRGHKAFVCVGRLDRRTGAVENLWHASGDKPGWGKLPTIGDETESLSLMGHILIGTHQGVLGGLDLRTRELVGLYAARDTYGGIFGPSAVPGYWKGAKEYRRKGYLVGMPNEWHGPDRSIVAVAGGRMFWVVGSMVVCLGGPDIPKTPTGGRKPPPPFKKKGPLLVGDGNVTALGVGGFDESVEKTPVRPEEMQRLVEREPGRARRSRSPLALALRGRLDAEVAELVDAWPWAPFIVELGISGEERHFWRTADTMQIVSLALPHLSPEVKTKAKRFLDALFEAGCPLRAPVHAGGHGKRREFHDLGPGMMRVAKGTPRHMPSVEDLYALWAYAYHADRWDEVLTQKGAMRQVFDAFARQPVRFDHGDRDGDSAEHLNAQIAGTLAYARVMLKAGEAAEVERATRRLAQLVTERVHHERADTSFVRSTKVASHGLHQAKIPRYVALVPEVAAILRERSGGAFERNVRGLAASLPVWYHAFGERLIGGENYISPPHLARGLFAAFAEGVRAEPDELARFIDQPWCRADLYYIEKLSAVLRAADGVR